MLPASTGPPLMCTGLLLLGGCNVMLSLALRQLIKRRRQAYIANRELLTVLGYSPAVLFTARQQSELELRACPRAWLRHSCRSSRVARMLSGAAAAADAAAGLLLRLAGVTRHLHRHGGNPLRLLGLLLLFHPGTWTLVGALIGGLTVAANQLILPAVALSTVSRW